ncbi:hypothetical protein A2U01_0100960, partial [Trifolium medium]|nr:hypothetical protein [Trifolium medium]
AQGQVVAQPHVQDQAVAQPHVQAQAEAQPQAQGHLVAQVVAVCFCFFPPYRRCGTLSSRT